MAKPMTRVEWENWVEKAWATAQESAKEPKEWVGLTDDEIHDAFNYVEFVKHISWDRETEDWCKNFAAYIETRLKEKNHETRPLDPQGQRQDPL